MSEAPSLATRDDKLGQEDLRTEPDTKGRNVRPAEDTRRGNQSHAYLDSESGIRPDADAQEIR